MSNSEDLLDGFEIGFLNYTSVKTASRNGRVFLRDVDLSMVAGRKNKGMRTALLVALILRLLRRKA